jgi:hypothetical protein
MTKLASYFSGGIVIFCALFAPITWAQASTVNLISKPSTFYQPKLWTQQFTDWV